METEFKLSEEQLNVISQCTEHLKSISDDNIMVVKAGAGTGKSTIIRELQYRLNKRINITAATNEAADLLRGTTLHKFLGFSFDTSDGPTYPKKLKPSEWILVDEYSLANKDILNWLEKSKHRVILFGDPEQLTVRGVPDTSNYPQATLTHNFRTSSEPIKKFIADLKAANLKPLVEYKVDGVIETFDKHKDFLTAILESRDDVLTVSYTNNHVDKYVDVICDPDHSVYAEHEILTIHKCQGKSVHTVAIDLSALVSAYKKPKTKYNPHPLSRAYLFTLLYVASSRATSRILLFTGNRRKFT